MAIYLDYAATTPLDPRVKNAMEPYLTEQYGNPGSVHRKGKEAKAAVEDARKKISTLLRCAPNEIVFTGGSTESINLALQGIARANAAHGNHIITTIAEHPAVLKTCHYLETQGFEITYLGVDRHGRISLSDLRHAIRDYTVLISVGLVNNETGAVQDLGAIAKVAHEHNILLHTDASQANGPVHIPILGVHLMTMTAGKMYGPKGVGLLYVKQGTLIRPILFGGGQEHGLRSGTENVAGIVGFARALELYTNKERKNVLDLSKKLRTHLRKVPHIAFNDSGVSSIINVSIRGVEGETIVKQCSEKGLYISAGSACHSGKLSPSPVLKAMDRTDEEALSSIRISLGRFTTTEEIKEAAAIIVSVVADLRKLSPTSLSLEKA